MSKPKTLNDVISENPEWLNLPVYVVDLQGRGHQLGSSAVCRLATYVNLNNPEEKQERVEFVFK